MGAVTGGLKLTRAAILAFLKKHRKPLQVWEARNNPKMGVAERNYLQRHPSVVAKMGGTTKGRKRKGAYGTATPGEVRDWDTLGGGDAVKGVVRILSNQMAKKRRKVTSAVKKGRKKGIKLSEYKGPNQTYETVRKLRKLIPKGRKKSEAPTMFNFPR